MGGTLLAQFFVHMEMEKRNHWEPASHTFLYFINNTVGLCTGPNRKWIVKIHMSIGKTGKK